MPTAKSTKVKKQAPVKFVNFIFYSYVILFGLFTVGVVIWQALSYTAVKRVTVLAPEVIITLIAFSAVQFVTCLVIANRNSSK